MIQADQVPLAPSIGGQITSEVVDSGGDLDYKQKLYRDELLCLTESLALPDSPLIGPPNGPSLTPPKGPSADGPPHGPEGPPESPPKSPPKSPPESQPDGPPFGKSDGPLLCATDLSELSDASGRKEDLK